MATSYLILKGNDCWKIKEKRYMTTVAVVRGSRSEALAKLSEIKEADKKAAEEKKQRKAEAKKAAEDFENEFIRNGKAWKDGFTKSGKRFILDGNCGMTERSRHCYTLTIEGLGCVFTSGTLEAAVEYIMNN